jgi:allantoin racemase
MIRRPKILIVNPNTSASVTALFAEEARLYAGGQVDIDAVTGTFGAAIVSTMAEDVVAAHSALNLLAEHAAGYDAVILAISFDSGLGAAREILPIPVVGITEAAISSALAHDGPFGLVTFGEISLPLYRRLLREYDVVDRLAGIEVIDVTSTGDYLDVARRDDAVRAAIERLIGQGAHSVIVGGAAVVGIARRLQPTVSVPLFDGAATSVALAITRIHARRDPIVPTRPLSSSTGISPALRALIEGKWPLPETEMPVSTPTKEKE